MAINNTYTEQFDWINMSPHKVEDNGTEQSVKIMNDYCPTDFKYPLETTGSAADSSVGQDNEAYKNWKNINLALGPLTGVENGVIAGQCRSTTASRKAPDGGGAGKDPQPHPGETSWFQGVKAADFSTDGLYLVPWRGHDTAQADVKWKIAPTNYDWTADNKGGYHEQNHATVLQYHVPGGLKANTWMPLLSWDGQFNSESEATAKGFDWRTDEGGVNYWEMYASEAASRTTNPVRSPHHRMHGLRSCPHSDTVWDQYDVDNSISWQDNNGHVQYAIVHRGYTQYRDNHYPVGWWYAHDGAGNAMIISLGHFWNSDHNTDGLAWNANWGMGGESGEHGALPASSGGFIHRPPKALVDATDAVGIAGIQQWANDQRSPYVYTDFETQLRNSWWQSTGIVHAGAYYNDGRTGSYTAGHKPEIVHGLTPFGSAADASLATPQNLYLHRYGNQRLWLGGFPKTSYKFGNLVKTHTTKAFYNGHGRGKDMYYPTGNGSRSVGAGSMSFGSPSFLAIAAQEVALETPVNGQSAGPVRINMITTGGQTGPVPEVINEETMFFEFPGTGTSYGAIDKNLSTPTTAPGAWENIEALVDPSNVNDAICKQSGVENAVYVPLVGMTEGNIPDGDDNVSTVSITLGGTRKMVLGPQVLKVQVVDKNDSPLTGEKTLPGEGSDVLNDDLTIVYPADSLDSNITYSVIREAKIKIWVHTP